jgi:hypothetical protein
LAAKVILLAKVLALPWLCPLASRDEANRLDEDQQIQGQTGVAQIVEVVAELQSAVGHARSIREANLSPATESRSDPVPYSVVGNLLLKFDLQLRSLWPGSYQAHLPPENSNKLWEFIKSELAEPSANPRDPLVSTTGPLGPP